MEQSRLIGGQHQQHIGGVDAQLDKPGCVQLPDPLLHRFGTQPQERPPFPRAQAEQGSNARAAAGILLIGEQFMQPPTRQPATQRRIDPVMPQREQRSGRSRAAWLQLLQALPQPGKNRRRIAHMFTICSIVPLRQSSEQ